MVNHYVNFGWEYVLHCHILSHEEMDMMRTQAVAVDPAAPTGVDHDPIWQGQEPDLHGDGPTTRRTRRRSSSNVESPVPPIRTPRSPWSRPRPGVASTPRHGPRTPPGVGPAQRRSIGNTKDVYEYQVYAINTVGDTWDYSDPAFNNIPAGGGFPTITVDSRHATA